MPKSTAPRVRKAANPKAVTETPQPQIVNATKSVLPDMTGFVATQIDLEAQIRQRAFQLYEERGRKPGHQDEDWLRAEQEVRAHNGNHNA
jgi:hypothetical protein